jgi:hypothetical protein
MSLKEKYLKYKQKYLSLKKQIGGIDNYQIGGFDNYQIGGIDNYIQSVITDDKYLKKYLKYKEKYVYLKNQFGSAGGGTHDGNNRREIIRTPLADNQIMIPYWVKRILLRDIKTDVNNHIRSIKTKHRVNIKIDEDYHYREPLIVTIEGSSKTSISAAKDELNTIIENIISTTPEPFGDREIFGRFYESDIDEHISNSDIVKNKLKSIIDAKDFEDFFNLSWLKKTDKKLPSFATKHQISGKSGKITATYFKIMDPDNDTDEICHYTIMYNVKGDQYDNANDKIHLTCFYKDKGGLKVLGSDGKSEIKFHLNMQLYYRKTDEIHGKYMISNIPAEGRFNVLPTVASVYKFDTVKIISEILEDFYNTYMKKVGRFFQFLQNRPTEAELRQRLNDIQDELQRDNTENNEHLVRDIIELFGRDANIYQSDVQYIEYIRNAIGGIPRDINMNVQIMRKLRTMKNRIDRLRIDLNMEETSKISDIIKYIKNSDDNTDGWLMNRIQNINVPAFNRLNSNINEIRRLYGDYNETTKNIEWFERALNIVIPRRLDQDRDQDRDQDSCDRTSIILDKLKEVYQFITDDDIFLRVGLYGNYITIMTLLDELKSDMVKITQYKSDGITLVNYGDETTPLYMKSETDAGWLQHNLKIVYNQL